MVNPDRSEAAAGRSASRKAGSAPQLPESFGGEPFLSVVPDLVKAAELSERTVTRRLREADCCALRDLLVLDEVHRSGPGGIRTKQLADRLVISTSRLAYQLRALETEGLVERTPHEEDGRGVLVNLTAKGAGEHRRAISAMREITEVGLASIGTEVPSASLVAAARAMRSSQDGRSRLQAADVAGFCDAFLEALQTAESFDRMFEQVADRLMSLLDLHLVRVLVKHQDVLSCIALRTRADTPIAPSGSSLRDVVRVPSTIVFETGEPVHSSSLAELEKRFPELAAFYEMAGMTVGARFAVPILRGNDVIGSLSGGSSDEFEWDEASRLLLSAAARAIAIRLECADGWVFPSSGTEDGAGSSEPGDGLDRSLLTAIAWGLEPEEAAGFLELGEAEVNGILSSAMARREVADRDSLIEILRREHAEVSVVRKTTGAVRRS